ncbi:discoidin domain-containing protein [Nocardia brasiliensis]|uniref:discoidin domain-containing protein n=1 Tax=Nocardia brasiliensis TaxID=37326 RepID=UPI002454D958|nr:discoidin domain-containing protein [Nocardia brasiliensis]
MPGQVIRFGSLCQRDWLIIGIGLSAVVALVTAVTLVVVDDGPTSTTMDAVCPADEAPATADWTPTSTEVDAPYDRHPFVGNGYLGLRVPPRGMGYVATGEMSGWPLYTPRYDGAFVAGLFAASPSVAEGREVIAAVPNWSALTVDVGGEKYDSATAATRISNFAQTLHLRCGLVRTSLTWTTTDGKATDLIYEVLADRSDEHVGAVRLTLVPHWSGEITVTDTLDGAGARRITGTETDTPAEDSVRVGFRTEGTEVKGSVASIVRTATPTTLRSAPGRDLTVAQDARFAVAAENTYEIAKFVGIDTALTSSDPATSAYQAAWRAAAKGWPRLLANSAALWRDLWAGDIELPGRGELQLWARGALYALYSSTNARQNNSISPVGLSSDNYAGQIFWDADIWIFPALMQLAPELARSVVEYRFKTLPAAQENARRLGLRGAFYPWTSGSQGALDECHSWDPPHCLIQVHLQGDIALAVWQYYLATRDERYLETRGWPILKNIAEFWVSRVTPNPDGSYSIKNVAGPDEYSNGVDDAVYTNAVAAIALRNAAKAAAVLGESRPAEWEVIADHLRMPFDPARNIFLQYDGYGGSSIKQADTALLIYPLEWAMPQDVSANILEYYSERTDPDGPAMTDSVHAIDAAAIGEPGCATATFLERAVRPFARAPFGQLAEARGSKAGTKDALAGAPAFTFVTAAGGFLQTFTNGLLGLRLRADAVELDPILPAEVGDGMRIRGLQWQGRTFDVQIGPADTVIKVRTGASMQVRTPNGVHTVGKDVPLTIRTRRPDLAPTDNLARCKPVSSSSHESGKYASAAIDGNAATTWAPNGMQGTLTVDLGTPTQIGKVLPLWATSTPASATVQVSPDDRHWTTLSADPSTGTLAAPTVTRYVRLDVTSTEPGRVPAVRELEIVSHPLGHR